MLAGMIFLSLLPREASRDFTFFHALMTSDSYICVIQLRGMSNKRQVPGAQVGLQQNFGIGGAAVVTLYKKFNSDRRSLLAKL